jgi:succinate dehydrogenase / fumarate reductase cytochrome b subunit
MTAAQTAFLVGLSLVSLGIVAFAILVLTRARAAVGRPPGLLSRLARPSTARLEVHRWAFYAHRISGLAIFAFLALHLVDVGLIAVSSDLYDEVHALYGTAPMRVFEVLLLAGILYHAFNGLRLLALDIVDTSARVSERLLWMAIGGTVLLTIPAAIVILGPVLA